MKYKLGLLLISLILLTSCQMGGRVNADILLENGNSYHFTNIQLSQEEYFSVIEQLKKPKVDYKYKFTLDRLGDTVYRSNKTSKGEYANYSFEEDGKEQSAFLFTSNLGGSFYMESTYQTNQFEGEARTYHEETTVNYGTYNNSLDYGMAVDYKYSDDYGVYDTFYNPNVPVNYPAQTDTVKVKTPSEHYTSMYRFRTFANMEEIVSTSGVDTTILSVSVDMGDSDYQFIDTPVFSHKLSSKHLVIEEKRRVPSNTPIQIKTALYAICREVEEHKDYYFNTEYYYNYENGHLDKVQCSFNTISTRYEAGARIAGSYTLEHQERLFADVMNKHYDYFFKFRNFNGVIVEREERTAQ